VALLLLGPPSLPAQPATSRPARLEHSHTIDRWSTADGLPGAVTAVTETADGDLWLGTVAGFVRFDGESFDIYDRDRVPDLPWSRVSALAPGRDSSLWVFTEQGHVVRWSAGAVTDRLDIGRDGLWPAIGSDGLYADDFWAWRPHIVYHVHDGRTEAFTSNVMFGVEDDAVVSISDVVRSRTGEVWVASPVGLARWADGSWSVVPRDSGLPAGRPGALLEDRAGRLWIATSGGIGVRVLGGAFQVAGLAEDSLGLALAMAEGIDGSLWVLNTNRLRHLRVTETGGVTHVTPLWDHELAALETTALHVDRLGDVWITGLDGSVSRISMATASRLGIEQGLPQRGVHHVVGDGSGGVWLGGGCHGVLHWDGSDLHRYVRPQLGLQTNCVNGLMRDSEGALWIGEAANAIRYAGGKVRTWSWKEETRPGPITPFLEDAAGQVWIGAGGKVLRIGTEGSIVEFGADLGLPGADVWSLAQTPDGHVWVGQVGTVSRWNGEAFETFGEGDGVPLDPIRSLHVNDDGSLWIGSYGGGIARFTDGTFTRITRANGLFDNSISAILEDGRHRLWLLGNLGVFTAPRATFDSVADGTSAKLDGVTFGPRDGVPEGNGGAPAGWLDADGTAWFATIDGLISLDAATFPYDTVAPRVRIDGVAAARGEVSGADPLVVPLGSGAVTIRYAAPGLPGGRGVRYRYRMLGLDEHWEDAGSGRVARFANLPPGRYEFQVLARNVDGVWSEAPSSVRLRVRHAWWQLPLVRGVAALIAAILIVAYVRRRMHAAEERSRRLLREIREREEAEDRARRRQRELEHMGRLATAGELASSLAHELNQPLTAIVGNAVVSSQMLSDPRVGKEAIREALDDIAGDSRRAAEIIRKLRTFIGRRQLEKAELDLNELIGEAVPIFRRELADHDIELDLALSPNLPPVEGDRVQLQQVLVNLALNAVDALKAEPPGHRTIRIETRKAERDARIAVSDTGPGIDEADLDRVFEPFFSTKEAGMGMGLAICSTIAEAHGGKLTAKRNPDRGVTFELSLPLHESAADS